MARLRRRRLSGRGELALSRDLDGPLVRLVTHALNEAAVSCRVGPGLRSSRKATVSNERQLGDSGSGVRERRRSLAAHDRRGFVDEIVVLKGLDHE
jgi:hypothetical protein